MEASEQTSELEQIPIQNEGDIVLARQSVRAFCQGLGFSTIDLTLIATAVSEISRNILEYAKRGTLSFRSEKKGRISGVVIIGEDSGPGIADVELAMRDGYSTRNSLGMGLPGIKRLMDDFSIQSQPGVGTKVVVKKWKS